MSDFSFKPLEETDIDLLYQWLKEPHVAEYWNEALSYEELRAKYLKRLNSDWIFSFIAYCQNKPVGFIHYYYAQKDKDFWPDAKEGETGIDLFIGEKDYLNKGYGTALLKEFIKLIAKDPKVKKLFIDVDPLNLRAKSCYEKAGFKEQGLMETKEGKALIMTKLLA